jgi:hypothetical protein
MALSLRNGPHLPATQCACAEFKDFAKQRSGGGGREKLYSSDGIGSISKSDFWTISASNSVFQRSNSICSKGEALS